VTTAEDRASRRALESITRLIRDAGDASPEVVATEVMAVLRGLGYRFFEAVSPFAPRHPEAGQIDPALRAIALQRAAAHAAAFRDRDTGPQEAIPAIPPVPTSQEGPAA